MIVWKTDKFTILWIEICTNVLMWRNESMPLQWNVHLHCSLDALRITQFPFGGDTCMSTSGGAERRVGFCYVFDMGEKTVEVNVSKW